MTQEKITFSIKDFSQINNEEISLSLSLPKDFDSKKGSEKTNYLVYRAFQNQLKNERQGTRSTKTRAEVRGGGRKPWKQKGSGRARAGSTRSPLWKGGGVSFGPRPKVYTSKINRKEWRLALNLLLFNKQNQIKVVNALNIPSQKTKDLVQVLMNLDLDLSKKVLILVSKNESNLQRPSKNLKNIKVLNASCLNIKELLISKSILFTKNSLKLLEETYYNG